MVGEPLPGLSSNYSQAMAQRPGWTQKRRKELRGSNLRVLDVRPISFELPAGRSVVKGGAEAGEIARKRKLAYLDHQRELAKQIPNKKLGCIPAHIGAKQLDPESQEVEVKQAGSSLTKANLVENTPRKKRRGSSLTKANLVENTPLKKRRGNEPKDRKEVKGVSDKEAQERRSVVSKFHSLVQMLAQEQETMKPEDDPKTKKVFNEASDRLKSLWQNLCKNHVGSVPGVEVGDVFQSRRLLSNIGLHRPLQAGIYYLKPEETGHMVPLATSIVLSGGYEDNIDNGDVIIYSGQGGNDHDRSKKQISHQELTKGNKALSNNHMKKQPVRLIRSCEELLCGYRYDGLYNVEKSWSEKGQAGFRVYKFKLRRKQDQPPLVSHIVRFRGSSHGKKTSVIKEDIGEGRHKFAIPVVNSVDNVHTLDYFRYLLTVRYPDWLPKPELGEGCRCIGGCTDAENCLCARRNGGEFPYRANGTLVKAKTLVYECGPKCRCPPTCTNRVTQRGLKHELEIYRTSYKDWGVRTLKFIQAGAFIAEYTGDLIVDSSRDNSMSKFIFPISFISMEGNWGDLRGVVKDDVVSVSPFQLVEDAGFKVDASSSGNATRFVRRSSRPNVFAQYVLHDHHDKRIPHVMLFALENISPQLQLSINPSTKQTMHSRLFSKDRYLDKTRMDSKFRK